MKFNNRLKKLKENLENTLGVERATWGLKILRRRGVKSPRN
jgi:hypothetical protein